MYIKQHKIRNYIIDQKTSYRNWQFLGANLLTIGFLLLIKVYQQIKRNNI